LLYEHLSNFKVLGPKRDLAVSFYNETKVIFSSFASKNFTNQLFYENKLAKGQLQLKPSSNGDEEEPGSIWFLG
jgi:hypothetical protein